LDRVAVFSAMLAKMGQIIARPVNSETKYKDKVKTGASVDLSAGSIGDLFHFGD
jgi:hypothetical protein